MFAWLNYSIASNLTLKKSPYFIINSIAVAHSLATEVPMFGALK
jgi:hypothetical protein